MSFTQGKCCLPHRWRAPTPPREQVQEWTSYHYHSCHVQLESLAHNFHPLSQSGPYGGLPTSRGKAGRGRPFTQLRHNFVVNMPGFAVLYTYSYPPIRSRPDELFSTKTLEQKRSRLRPVSFYSRDSVLHAIQGHTGFLKRTNMFSRAFFHPRAQTQQDGLLNLPGAVPWPRIHLSPPYPWSSNGAKGQSRWALCIRLPTPKIFPRSP